MPQPNPIHRHSSRGRTRQPKNLALPIHESQAIALASGTVGIVAAAVDLEDELNDVTAAKNGYDTQNQNYLHLMLRSGATIGTITVYAYNRCFGKWGKLRIPISNAASAAAMYVPATFTGTANTVEYVVVPIHGIDRVAFVGTANNLLVYAAGSTI